MKKKQIPFLDYVRLAGLLYAARTNTMNKRVYSFWYDELYRLLKQYFPTKWKRGDTLTMEDLDSLEVIDVY